MTPEQFLKKYHTFNVKTKKECLDEIEKIEPVLENTPSGTIVHIIYPVEFRGIGWCLMLDTAYKAIKEGGII